MLRTRLHRWTKSCGQAVLQRCRRGAQRCRRAVRFSPQSTVYGLRSASAFTIVELLVVISIMALLMGIIVPSYFSIREKAKYTKAKVTVKNLETAFKAYLDHYRVWPDVLKEDTAVEIKNEVFQILRGDSGISANPDAIAFYEFETTNSTDGALDPFTDSTTPATPVNYRVLVDKNYDNKITVGGPDLYRTVIVWSVGTNRSDAGDLTPASATKEGNVRSWD